MPDWSALRQRARTHHARLRATLPPDNLPLPAAEALLAAAEAETGYQRIAVSRRDSLLAGAHAVLNRDMECIWFAHESPPPRRRFAQAHEFAHYWLHPYSESCAVDADLDLLRVTPFTAAAQVAEGYSPKQRREDEANVFAAEFLLPAASLRRAFVDHRWSAARIAEHVGVSESCVLAQLEEALLLPIPPEELLPGEAPTSTKRRKNRMDQSQKRAAEVRQGPVLVDAGPGTGKTHTLVGRAIYLISERGVAPENLLALTFSNKAAEEMRTRLRAAVGDPADLAWIGTFHAFGYEILRRFGQRIGLPLTPRLLDNADAVTLLERHLDRLPLSEYAYLHDPSLPFLDILSCISRAKDEMKTPQDYLHAVRMQRQNARNDKDAIAAVKAEEVGLVYAVYQELLDESRLLDFGDLIMKSVLLLDSFPEVQASLQAQFPHILADEYQDVNRASAQLVKRLAGEGRGLWAVGDLRQAIYRFRGASPANVSAFEHDYPGGRRLRLESNYRSVPPIVSLFAAMASQMRSAEAPGDTLTPGPSPTLRERGEKPGTGAASIDAIDPDAQTLSRPAGETPNLWAGMWHPQRIAQEHAAITVAVAEDEEAQADGLASQIRAWEAKGVPFREQAILCRTNAQATDLSSALEARGIATLHLGDLFGRPEVKDLLAVIAVASEPEGMALTRVARFPEYAVPFEDVQRLWTSAVKADRPFPAALDLAVGIPDLSETGRAGLTRLWRHLKPLIHRGDPWMLLARYLFQRSRYLHPLLASEAIADQQKLLAIHQLLGFVAALSQKLTAEHERVTGADFLNRLRHLILCREDRMARLPAGAEALNGVRLMTVHASKGLEFPVIYLPNLVKGQFPPRGQSAMASPPASLFADGVSWPDMDGEEEAGEECLFFVALSRARDHLVLSRPKAWRGKPVPPSPLLAEMEAALSACNADRQEWLPAGPGPFGESAASELSPDEEAGASAAAAPPNDESSKGDADDRPSVSLSALEQYRRCPRQYFYQRVAKLPEKRSEAVYVAFHVCVERTMEWLKAERQQHRMPSLDEAKAHLAEVWAQSGPDVEKTATARVLRDQADLIVMNAYYPLVDAPFVAQEMRLTAELPNGNVHLLAENAEQLPDGTLRLVREIKGRGRPDDHTDPRLALIRLAAKQKNGSRPVQIALSYLREGTVREIEESKRYEPARVAKYDAALKGIRENRFPPAPDDRACPRCPFFFLCPI